MLPDYLKFCNCAQCGDEIISKASWAILSDEQKEFWKGKIVAGRILDRPYCGPCLRVRNKIGGGGISNRDDASPGQENAIRIWE